MAASFAVTVPAHAATPAAGPPTPGIATVGIPTMALPAGALPDLRPVSQVVVSTSVGPKQESVVTSTWPRVSAGDNTIHPTPLGPARRVADQTAAAGDVVRIGNLELRRPRAVSPQLASDISAGSGELVAGISDVLRSNGVSTARADKVAEQMVGDAAVGGVIGAGVAAPLALAVGGVVGGGLGLLLTLPLWPTGLVFGPLIGTAVVATLVALPAVAAGVAIGAAHGYDKGWKVPLNRKPAKRPQPTTASLDRAPALVAPSVPATSIKRLTPMPAVKQVAPAPVVKRVTPTPAVKQIAPSAPARRDALPCTWARIAEVALQGGAIGSC
ncbi:hypothetical protein QEN40_21375 [Gordonia alkanivorans]|jgi:hypothetical protein|nr:MULTISPECIES: hypothetical protein [Gordonia]MDH3009224.1 hypothetical protein [Gordonia alkanivorans]MDH3043507.1 hypothetical protein [Gordonia alkanivorans]MDH3047365.1 hypothetical protein [Gordonia alkanivorans]WJG12743.1 hypothetical protein PWF70_19510 [Gordonia sp. Swx-4]